MFWMTRHDSMHSGVHHFESHQQHDFRPGFVHPRLSASPALNSHLRHCWTSGSIWTHRHASANPMKTVTNVPHSSLGAAFPSVVTHGNVEGPLSFCSSGTSESAPRCLYGFEQNQTFDLPDPSNLSNSSQSSRFGWWSDLRGKRKCAGDLRNPRCQVSQACCEIARGSCWVQVHSHKQGWSTFA